MMKNSTIIIYVPKTWVIFQSIFTVFKNTLPTIARIWPVNCFDVFTYNQVLLCWDYNFHNHYDYLCMCTNSFLSHPQLLEFHKQSVKREFQNKIYQMDAETFISSAVAVAVRRKIPEFSARNGFNRPKRV